MIRIVSILVMIHNPSEDIRRFVSTGPKSYSYICNTGTEKVKFKGVQLSFRDNLREITFESVGKNLFGEISKISLPLHVQFMRQKFNGIIYNQLQSNIFKTYI